jgi:hypothetical protein
MLTEGIIKLERHERRSVGDGIKWFREVPLEYLRGVRI